MFDTIYRDATDAGLVAAIAEMAAAEAASAARRFSAIAELVRRRCGDAEHSLWSCDEWDAAAAEISAALGISHGRASGQMDVAVALRLRLPRVAELFLAGELGARVVTAIMWRTALVTDHEALKLIDAAVSEHARGWNALSQHKMDQAIDTWVDRHDPGALRRARTSARNRDVIVGSHNHETGTASLWGRLLATDAAVLERRLAQMARQVCEDDPRTLAQRRADALGALAAGAQRLACRCGGPGCPSADARASSVVIHVLADSEPRESSDALQESAGGSAPSAVIVGGGVVPAPLLADLLRDGATVRHIRKPIGAPEPRYRPSTSLDEFVRMRDLTCRFPHCDAPAEVCDIDHAIPWPAGPTHPSNLRLLCRKHHLLKTFWSGEGGWRDEQSPDGSIVWTAPTGHRYTTHPGSRLIFPRWNTETAALSVVGARSAGERGLMMPSRRRSRAAARAYRIRCERSLNDAHVAERNRPPPF